MREKYKDHDLHFNCGRLCADRYKRGIIERQRKICCRKPP